MYVCGWQGEGGTQLKDEMLFAAEQQHWAWRGSDGG